MPNNQQVTITLTVDCWKVIMDFMSDDEFSNWLEDSGSDRD